MRIRKCHLTTGGWSVACALTLTIVAHDALAEPIDVRREVDPDVRVIVKNINGTVTVEGWTRTEVTVTGELAEEAEELDVSGSKGRLRIEVKYPSRMRNVRGQTDLELKVPVGADVVVDAVNCNIEASKVEGELRLESVNGDILVEGKPAVVEAQTVNGRIEIAATTSEVKAETVGGRIVLDGVSGEVSAGAVGGSIHVRGGSFESAEFATVSGDIEFTGELSGDGSFDFDTHNGDIVLELPADTSAEFEVSTFSGDIDNDFGPDGRRSRRHGPGRELYFTVGSGAARVSINTFNGDVRLIQK
jgi:DUF4097 and DUF4098 domain-containing protein YvlB